MFNLRILAFFLAIAPLLAGCVSLAPGADKVRLVNRATDVSGCTAVGNVTIPGDSNGQVDVFNAETQFRNRVVGLGGNTGYVTSGPIGAPYEGIAYRCP